MKILSSFTQFHGILCLYVFQFNLFFFFFTKKVSTLFSRNKEGSASKMSLSEEREDEDTAFKMSSPFPGSSCNQPMKNLLSSFSDATVTSDPRYITSCFCIWQMHLSKLT